MIDLAISFIHPLILSIPPHSKPLPPSLHKQSGPKRIPWKAIGYALLLFAAGTLLLVMGSLLVTGYFDEKYADRTWPVIILGALMFIPGAYHSYVAYYAFKGYEGYSFDDIPSYED